MIAGTSQKLYICPGEGHPISRSVHLSRLAAFYPVCRDCPLRTDTGHLPGQIVERLQQTERRVQRRSLYTTEGVRGVYINDLTRKKAGRIATALADLLVEQGLFMGHPMSLKLERDTEGWTLMLVLPRDYNKMNTRETLAFFANNICALAFPGATASFVCVDSEFEPFDILVPPTYFSD